MLHKDFVHSVRDSFTEQRLKSIGVENIYNTSCPTMWGLNEEHCKKIPTERSESVITTITDYDRNPKKDMFLLDALSKNYKNVYLWFQGKYDKQYFNTLFVSKNIRIIDTLEQFHELLTNENVEYIGTRLHAGIEALNYGRRS